MCAHAFMLHCHLVLYLKVRVLDYIVMHVADIMLISIVFRVEVLLKLEMVYWRYRRPSVRLA